MSLFDRLYPDATAEERAEFERIKADIDAHFGQRPCPGGCGCTEFFDDRDPDESTGGFGVAGCLCPRCNDVDPITAADAEQEALDHIFDVEEDPS